MEATEQLGAEPAAPPKNLGPTFYDKLFLVLLFLVLVSVTWVGRINYKEGMKVEIAKENADAWTKWLASASAERTKPGFEPAACAGIAPKHGSDKQAAQPATSTEAGSPPAGAKVWGDCLNALIAPEGPMSKLRNAFTGEMPAVVAKCDPADKSLAGAIVIEKMLPAPPGSAVPIVISPLAENDPIDQKLPLRALACDSGAYPGKPTEFEF